MSDARKPGLLFGGLPVEPAPEPSAHEPVRLQDQGQPKPTPLPDVHQGARQPTDDEDAKFAGVMRRTFPSVR